MGKPLAVVFDLGKVLVDFDYGLTARALAPHCALPAAELLRLLNQSPLLHRYESGELTTAQFYAEVRAASGFRGGLEEFSALFGDIFTPIAPMLALHTRLRAGGVPLFVFSNTNALAVRHIREHFAFFTQFDGYILSYEHGAMKPDARLYEVVERVTGRRGADLLYVDDRPENIATAQARGWHSVLHESPEQTLRAVRAAGLLA